MVLFSNLASITKGEVLNLYEDRTVNLLITDSRKAIIANDSVFFAISGLHHDGHAFIRTLFDLGIRQFVVEHPIDDIVLKNSNVLQVKSSLSAIQQLAAHRRSTIDIPIIGITGSNGKTIIKEWLFQLLSLDFKIAKNPGSYNSQLGVPLSVWQLQSHHELGIFEAGISRPGEMGRLEEIIRPTIGIFTNIGSAHDEGFQNPQQKISEKLLLFKETKKLIYCRDHQPIHEALSKINIPTLSWGFSEAADISISRQGEQYVIRYGDEKFSVTPPFKDQASLENCFHCVSLMLYLGFSGGKINERLNVLRSVPMRLELKEGINQCQVIDDTYNNDLAGLQISLEFLSNQQQKANKRLILSDILESGLTDEVLATKIATLVDSHHVRFIGIGKVLFGQKDKFHEGSRFFESTEDFIAQFDLNELQQEIILVKGARAFAFEKIVNRLQKKVHGTVMEIDLGAVVHNLNFFRARLQPTTKIMAMVKAFAYGSGSTEIANVLQYHRVDYLGVAYADEGVELRKNNISLPIMVMNPAEETFETLVAYSLEPEIYSFRTFEKLLQFLNGKPLRIHLKIDTGMHRLGFSQQDLPQLITRLKKNSHLTVASIFSHLAGADEAQHDDFSFSQGKQFQHQADQISSAIGYKPLYHLLNSPGILRLPSMQFDMVRLGIGLYGVDPTEDHISGLKPVATLKTMISQIKNISAGETIGYGRRGKAEGDIQVATIAIGYADGFSRAFSRGKGKVIVNGKIAPVIGNVCMDMTMIDITGIQAQEGDDVIIFGEALPIQDVAKSINTIPYEILTNTSERVKRVFVAESI